MSRTSRTTLRLPLHLGLLLLGLGAAQPAFATIALPEVC